MDWVAASSAFGEDGVALPGMVSAETFEIYSNPSLAAALRKSRGFSDVVTITDSQCLTFSEEAEGEQSRNLSEMVRDSHTIVSGYVRSALPGFYRGNPATLVRVDVEILFRGPRASSLFLVIPSARFVVGDLVICRGVSSAPPIGSSLVAFVRDNVRGLEAKLYSLSPDDYFVVSEGGSVRVPRAFNTDGNAIRNSSDLEGRLRDAIRAGGRK